MAREPKTFDDLYASRFLKAGNFDGKKVTLTLKRAYNEDLEGEDGTKRKTILSFVETDREHVACKTNGICIREMFGNRLADWVGKRVTLYPDTWNGEPCIRVWGSPDIQADMTVQVKLPRRKPATRTLHCTAPARATEHDPNTGEVPMREPGED